MVTSIIIRHKKISRQNISKLAIFDVDWTLIKPKDGRPFPKDKDDWMWLRESVPSVVKSFKNQYHIVFVTDQSKPWKKDMIEDVCKELDIPITVLIAMDKKLHKPNPELFNSVFKKYDTKESFMVGDTGGRKGDWAAKDKDFATAIKVKYITPEEMFPINKIKKVLVELKSSEQEVVIMIGIQGSGKSTIAKTKFSDSYEIISGDIFKTPAKMIKEAKKHVSNKSIIFDATNGTKKRRKLFIDFAEKYNLPVKCVWVDRTLEVALEQVKEREKNGGPHVSKIALYVFRKKFEEPTKDEGLNVIIFKV